MTAIGASRVLSPDRLGMSNNLLPIGPLAGYINLPFGIMPQIETPNIPESTKIQISPESNGLTA